MRQKRTTISPAVAAQRISERGEREAAILEKKTPNAQRPTSNVQLGNSQRHLAFFSAVRILEKKILMSSSVSLRIAAVFVDDMIDDLQASRNHRRGSFNSLRQILICERNLCVIRRLQPHHGYRMVKSHSERADLQDGLRLSYLAVHPPIG